MTRQFMCSAPPVSGNDDLLYAMHLTLLQNSVILHYCILQGQVECDALSMCGGTGITTAFRSGGTMEISSHITAVGQEAKLLVQAAEQGGLDADVPTCPGWDVRELLRHLGMIHLWAAGHVIEVHEGAWHTHADLTELWPDLAVFWPDDEKLIDWYLETNANLVDALESAPLDAERWISRSWEPKSSSVGTWARRQAHETAVHRFDAQNAAGIASQFDPTFASDGIDELLAGMAPRRKEFRLASTRTMLVHATDTDDRRHLTIGPEDLTTIRGDGPGDVVLAGDAADLYMAVWNRGDDSKIAVTGDRELLDAWHDDQHVRWD